MVPRLQLLLILHLSSRKNDASSGYSEPAAVCLQATYPQWVPAATAKYFTMEPQHLAAKQTLTIYPQNQLIHISTRSPDKNRWFLLRFLDSAN